MIAKRALGTNVVKDFHCITHQGIEIGKNNALISGGIEACSSTYQYLKGEKTAKEAITSTGKEMVIGGISATSGDIIGTGTAIGVGLLFPPVAGPAGIVTSIGVSILTDKGLRKITDIASLS